MSKRVIPSASEGMLPRMPEDGVFIDLGYIKAKLDMDSERYSSGSMRFKFEDTTVRISQGEGDEKKELGKICGCIGGGIALGIGGRDYFISAKELWRIAQEIDRKYLEQRGKQ